MKIFTFFPQRLRNFIVGAILYCSIELLWRGRTHFTMGILGGIVFMLLNDIETGIGDAPLMCKALFGSAIITVLELFAGILLNIKMGLAIWNYSEVTYNILGQICPIYSFYWFLLSTVAFIIIKLTNNKIGKTKEKKTANA